MPTNERVFATLPCVGRAASVPDIDDAGDLDRAQSPDSSMSLEAK